jgi:hypothetical protein
MNAIITKDEKLEKIRNLPIIDSKNPSKKYSEKEERYLRELVKYEFMNLEEPGLMLPFSYGNTKNKHTFSFMHGGTYILPRFIARHVESRGTPIWRYKPNGYGQMEKKLDGTKSRFQLREVLE